jgi:hypothetical protein
MAFGVVDILSVTSAEVVDSSSLLITKNQVK